jgi:hypothetical protein
MLHVEEKKLLSSRWKEGAQEPILAREGDLDGLQGDKQVKLLMTLLARASLALPMPVVHHKCNLIQELSWLKTLTQWNETFTSHYIPLG